MTTSFKYITNILQYSIKQVYCKVFGFFLNSPKRFILAIKAEQLKEDLRIASDHENSHLNLT